MTFEAETFYNMDMIKSLGISLHCSTCLKKLQEQYKKITLDYNLFSIKTKAVLSVVGMAIQFTAFGYCLFRLWTHAITYGTMTLFLQQRNSLSGAFQNLVSIIPSFLNSSVSAHRLRELTELPKEIHSMQNQKDLFLTKGGLEDLQERLCVRPTSETLFCDFYKNDIQSYRDLPKVYTSGVL